MSTSYIGEIRLFGFGFATVGWLPCDGRLLPIANYDTLYALIGTIYGGDGVNTFGLPDLRGRLPVHQGQGIGMQNSYVIGQMGGVESAQLLTNHMPTHTHLVHASNAAAISPGPSSAVLPAAISGDTLYSSDTSGSEFILASSAVSLQGGGLPHDNTMPTLTMNFCICVEGIFPSRN